MPLPFKYSAVNEAPIYESITPDGNGKKLINRILMGTYVSIAEENGDWYKIITAGPDGWIHKSQLTDNMGLKIFFLDVGQGDGALIEIGDYKILIDAGPANNMYSYLTKWQYTYLLRSNQKVHIDYLIVSHFDYDHYRGYLKILEHPDFTFGQVCHPGILKFAAKTNPYNTDLGNRIEDQGQKYLTTLFSNLLTEAEPAPFNRDVTNFIEALQKANTEGRVEKVKRLREGNIIINKKIEGTPFLMEVLAPFVERVKNKNAVAYHSDEAQTINGNSLVIKISFGGRTFLFGGDLNSRAEEYLMKKYGNANPFRVDVAKTCHHGSSDFTTAFMQKISPYASVISSGDNESFSHPRADAIGCAGRYTRGDRPLVFSTELARSTNIKTGKIIFGMINCRCNGNEIHISQMKESNAGADIWDSYQVDA